MDEGQEHQWHIELDHLRMQVRFALENLDSLEKRNEVKGKLENVYFTLDELCEQTKEQS